MQAMFVRIRSICQRNVYCTPWGFRSSQFSPGTHSIAMRRINFFATGAPPLSKCGNSEFFCSFQYRNINYYSFDCLEVSERLVEELFGQQNIDVILISDISMVFWLLIIMQDSIAKFNEARSRNDPLECFAWSAIIGTIFLNIFLFLQWLQIQKKVDCFFRTVCKERTSCGCSTIL